MSFNRTIYKTKTSNKIKQTNNTATNILKKKKHAFHVDIRNIFDVATPTWQNNLRLDSQLSIQPNVQPNLMVMLTAKHSVKPTAKYSAKSTVKHTAKHTSKPIMRMRRSLVLQYFFFTNTIPFSFVNTLYN
jgi:hypothetical protein